MAAAVIIASKHYPGMRSVHDKSWAVMRVSCGAIEQERS